MGLIKCPECGHSVSSKAPFCPNCGVIIDGNIKRCPVCGEYVLMAADHCPKCGTKFVVEPHPSLTPSLTPDPSPVGRGESPTPSLIPDPSPVGRGESPSREGGRNGNENANEDSRKNAREMHEAEINNGEGSRAPIVTSHHSSGFLTWFILLAAIVLICIGGVFYFENERESAREEQAFELLRDCNNSLNYEDFIARYPNSRHIDEVRTLLSGLQEEEALWKTVCSGGDATALRQFMADHPSSLYKKVALHKIDSLDWREADRVGTFASYDAYVQAHDNGEYIDQAFTAREAARQREAQAMRDSIAAARADSIANAAAAAVLGIVAAE